MKSKHAFEAVNRLFRDLCKNNIIFGGKVMIVSGDFRQMLSVVKHGNRTNVIENCVKNSKLWFCFQHISLKDNLRVNDNDLKIKEWLLNIGDGKCLSEFEKENEAIEIPEEFLINQDIITEIFGGKLNVNDEKIRKKVILAPKNVDVHSTNNEIQLKIESDVH